MTAPAPANSPIAQAAEPTQSPALKPAGEVDLANSNMQNFAKESLLVIELGDVYIPVSAGIGVDPEDTTY